MNRRQFCSRCAVAAICAVGKCEIPRWIAAAPPASPRIGDETYALWSLLVPELQSQPGRGYMIVQKTAVPDALPCIQTGEPLTPIEKARRAATQLTIAYQTEVPSLYQTSFTEALDQASQQRAEIPLIERRLKLNKRYRVLSEEQVKAYFDLSPAATASDWRPDQEVAREYKDWNELSAISLPLFDSRQNLALIWASTNAGCSSSGWWFFTRTVNGWKRQEWPTERREVCA